MSIHCIGYYNFNFQPKKLKINHKFKKCQIKFPPNINKIIHIFFIVDFKFLKTLKTNALMIVENTLYPTHSTNFLPFLHFLRIFHYFNPQNMSMGDFFGKFKNLASTILIIPCLIYIQAEFGVVVQVALTLHDFCFSKQIV